MYAGVMAVDLVLPSRSLKEKRSLVRPMIAHLRRQFAVAAAESGYLDVVGRTLIGVTAVAADLTHSRDVLDSCERWLASEPHVQFVSARRTYVSEEELG